MIVPAFAVGAMWMMRRGAGAGDVLWRVFVVLLAVLALSGVGAMKSGEAEEDAVEQIVGKQNLHEHEERGEALVWTAFVVALLGAGAHFVPNAKARSTLRVVALSGSIVVSVLAARVGHSGGSLVYKMGATDAYRK